MRVLFKWLSFLCCSYALSVSAAGNDRANTDRTNHGVRMPKFERVVLNNGTTLLLMERHDVPLIAFDASLRGGAVTDSPGKFGAAHLLAELLLKGAGQRDAAQFAEAVAAVGGSIEGSASLEAITVDGEFMARDQALMIELLSDVLQRPHLDAMEFTKLRERQIEFLRAQKDSNLDSLLPVYAAAALFGSHPYAHPITGDETSLSGLQYAVVKQAYEQQFGADRLVIAVAGDFDSRILKAQLTKSFSHWHAAKAVLPRIAAPIPRRGKQVVLIDAPESVQTYFWIGNVGVSRSNEHRVALDLVNTLFGGRFTSMLNSELRIKSGLTYGARSKLSEYLQPGSWSIRSFTKTESTVEAIDLALNTYSKLRRDGLDEAALKSGRNYSLGQFPLHYETAAHWAGAMADLEFYKLPPSEIDEYANRLQAVTATDATRVILKALPENDNLLIVLIGNAAQIREQVAKYGTVSEMKLSAPTFGI
jgi:zinc protease